MVEFERQIHALILHPAQVDILGDLGSYHRRSRFALDEDAFAFLVEVVGLNTDLVIQSQFDTYVGLRRLFPGHVGIADLSGRVTVRRNTRIDRAAGARGSPNETGGGDVHRRVIGETTASADLVVTDFAIRTSDLQYIDLVAQRLPEFLVADHVTQRIGGEETVSLARSEVLRTVVAAVELQEIFVPEGVGDAGRNTHVPIGESRDIGSGDVIGPVAYAVKEQGAYAVVIGKEPFVGEASLEVDRRPAGIGPRERHVARSDDRLVENQVAVLVAAGGRIDVGGVGPVEGRRVLGVP